MCIGCYVDEGCPQIVTPETRAASDLIARVYEHSCMGGNLHIVVDDWNLEDENLDACLRFIGEGKDAAVQLADERACYDALRKLSMGERAAALALHHGFLLADGSLSEYAARVAAVAKTLPKEDDEACM